MIERQKPSTNSLVQAEALLRASRQNLTAAVKPHRWARSIGFFLRSALNTRETVKASQAITEFQLACHLHFTCFTFAVMGLEVLAERVSAMATDKDKTLHIGSAHPNEGHVHAAVKIGDAISHSQVDGLFADQIAKSILTTIYTEWDELYRHKFAAEVGAASSDVKCDLMGDVRIIRNCIIHRKSVISDEHQRTKALRWILAPGPLTITKKMFSDLIDQLNQVQVCVKPE